MKYYIPNNSSQKLGGGFTFIRNFDKIMPKYDWHRVLDKKDSDLMFIAGATMVERSEVVNYHDENKPIILRVDNVPKDSRNRGTAISRLKDFSELADVVVYQSNWAMNYATPITGPGVVIYNGVDTSIFNSINRQRPTNSRQKRYLFVQYNRDENKRFPEAAYNFHEIYKGNDTAELWVVGQFSPELVSYNFDFWNGENITYIPVIEDPKQMADIMRDCDVLLFPAFADAAPNTVLEARACGLEIDLVNDIGGTKEMLDPKLDISLERMGLEYSNLFNFLTKKK